MITKNVCIRVDSSYEIGSGHVMRCLCLAKALREEGCSVFFICRSLPGNMIGYIQTEDFIVKVLPYNQRSAEIVAGEDSYVSWLAENYNTEIDQTLDVINNLDFYVSLLIVDHYAIDERWERQLRRVVDQIMVIDDIANRPHVCDYLLDQNYYHQMSSRYTSLVSSHTKLMLGPKFTILRDEFRQYRGLIRFPRKSNRIFIFFGATDAAGLTVKTVNALSYVSEKFKLEVIVGPNNVDSDELQRLSTIYTNINLHRNVSNIASLMAQSRFSICSTGTTTWERCCLGLPGITISMADNQRSIAQSMSDIGFDIYLGHVTKINVNDIIGAFYSLVSEEGKIDKMSDIGFGLVDGQGLKRIMQEVL